MSRQTAEDNPRLYMNFHLSTKEDLKPTIYSE